MRHRIRRRSRERLRLATLPGGLVAKLPPGLGARSGRRSASGAKRSVSSPRNSRQSRPFTASVRAELVLQRRAVVLLGFVDIHEEHDKRCRFFGRLPAVILSRSVFEVLHLLPGRRADVECGEAVPYGRTLALDCHQVLFEGIALEHLASLVFARVRDRNRLPGDFKGEHGSVPWGVFGDNAGHQQWDAFERPRNPLLTISRQPSRICPRRHRCVTSGSTSPALSVPLHPLRERTMRSQASSWAVSSPRRIDEPTAGVSPCWRLPRTTASSSRIINYWGTTGSPLFETACAGT